MSTHHQHSLVCFAALLASACGGTIDIVDESIGIAAGALEQENALTPNALTPNALTPNALTPNALTPNALTPNALAAISAPGDGGALSRELLRYVVSCALDSTQSFSFSWIDELGAVHEETYSGSIGLATHWAEEPLPEAGQEWVSACLAARVNWYGTSVTISARASHPALNKAGTPEITEYSEEEGAFWGNLFGDTPRLYACHHAPNNSHSRDQTRDCAAGHLSGGSTEEQCGIIEILGHCDTFCEVLHPIGVYHVSCDATPGYGEPASAKAITVFLPQ